MTESEEATLLALPREPRPPVGKASELLIFDGKDFRVVYKAIPFFEYCVSDKQLEVRCIRMARMFVSISSLRRA